jgi:hypothetical protein
VTRPCEHVLHDGGIEPDDDRVQRDGLEGVSVGGLGRYICGEGGIGGGGGWTLAGTSTRIPGMLC